MIYLSKLKKIANGFTLIELLVVIAVISLLASVVLVALNSTRVKARNTKRLADIKHLITAFSLQYDANGSFPSSGGTWVCVNAGANCDGLWNTYLNNPTVTNSIVPTYLSQKPTDPVDSNRGRGGYLYHGNWPGGTGYGSIVFPAGVYLDWAMELPYSSNSCGSGQPWAVSTYIECLVKLD